MVRRREGFVESSSNSLFDVLETVWGMGTVCFAVVLMKAAGDGGEGGVQGQLGHPAIEGECAAAWQAQAGAGGDAALLKATLDQPPPPLP